MTQSDPNARPHAKLSASQTKRWMACPGSVRAIDEIPEIMRPPQSRYAALGTAAHSLVEECIRHKLPDCRVYTGYWIQPDGQIDRVKRHPQAFEVDYDMMDAVDVMLDVVWKEMERLGPQAELRCEHKFDLSWLRPDMFGTNDVSISLFLDELVVIDYKHGQGVPVEVAYFDEVLNKLVGNSQLSYYGLGAAHGYDFTHERITLIVVQPRCPHPHGGVRRFTMTMADLLEFRDKLAQAADVVNVAYEAYDNCSSEIDHMDWEELFLIPGDHCKTAFCAKLATCPAVARLAMKEACIDFAEDPPKNLRVLPPKELDELAKALKWVPVLDARNREIEAQAHRLALTGVKIEGYKLVRKRAHRSWAVDPAGVIARLETAGVQGYMSTPELLSPAKIEKLGPAARVIVNGKKGKHDDEWEVEPLAKKNVGGLTLALNEDPREEVQSDVTADFPEDDADMGDNYE